MRRPDPTEQPRLSFTPYAWAKLQWFCHHGGTEIGGFGLTSPDNPLLIVDLITIKQTNSVVSVVFDDEAVADLFDQQVEAGRSPQHFARIWLHTHPGNSASPSHTDEETFDRVFGRCDWALMFILAKGGDTYARMRFNAGPGGSIELDTAVDYSVPFNASDTPTWQADYTHHIHPTPAPGIAPGNINFTNHDQRVQHGMALREAGLDPADAWENVAMLQELDEQDRFELAGLLAAAQDAGVWPEDDAMEMDEHDPEDSAYLLGCEPMWTPAFPSEGDE